MKQITLSIVFSLPIMLALFTHSGNEKVKFSPNFALVSNMPPSCGPACQPNDSMALVAIYDSAGGPAWTNSWILSDPVCTWFGVTLTPSGQVDSLDISNNGLNGTLPADIGDLAASLTNFEIDNNCLSGPIPPEIGNCINLEKIFLDNNKFTGTIPESFGQLVNVQTLFLDNNQLTGAVPEELLTMSSLQSLAIFNNCLDSIPDLSGMPFLAPGNFRVYDNKFTFDDLLTNTIWIGTWYEPQDSFGTAITICLPTGVDTFINLGIDAGITTNSYQWFKDGVSFSTTSSNKLFFNPVSWDTEGDYTSNVTNSIMTDLTLHGRPITVKVVCGQSKEIIKQTFCSGSGDNIVVGSTVFDEGFPSGVVDVPDLDQYGCDSIVEVDLTYYSSPLMVIDTILCPGESIIVNGTEFDTPTTSAIVNLGQIAQFSCDSIVEVNVSFYPTTVEILNPMICLDDSLEVFGKYYYFGNSSGIDTIAGVAFHGCDSIIQTNLSFFPQALAVFDDVLCTGNSITIAGNVYDETNPSDTLILENMSEVNACDSIIHIDLTFGPGVEITIDDVLCDGESIVVNGMTYDQDTPMGAEPFPSSNPSECDTTVFIDLSFYLPDTGYYSPVVCQGGSVTFYGTVYDNATPSGTQIIPSQLYPQCDSTIIVQLSFTPSPSSTIDTTICPDESIVINGTVYDINMPDGLDTISVLGFCDSLLIVNVSFFEEPVTNIDTMLCPGDFIVVDNIVYDFDNPTGSTTVSGASFHACDSIVNVNLTFFPEAINNIDTMLCIGESIFIEGTEYNETNTNGTDIISADPSFYGCDSTINIMVSYFSVSENVVDDILCFGESLTINNEIYDASNSTDTIVLAGASFNECDSTIYVDLEFYPQATGSFNTTICLGDTININGTDYHEGNTDGVETLTMQSFYNCDSILTVHVDFFELATINIDTTLCFGEEIIIGGMLINAATAQLIELENANYNGCDSVIVFSVDFYEEAFELIDPTLCFGQSIVVNNITYNESNPDGMDTIFAGSFYGCDSIIEIDLSFNSSVQVTFDDMLCLGDSMIFNGETYDEFNPSGIDTIPMGSYLGCDSIIVVDLQFPTGPAVDTIDGYYCEDVSFVVNGVVYDFASPFGTETLTAGSSFGCDSTVYVDLQFFDPAFYELDMTLCLGDSLVIEGVVYDESNPSGVITYENESFRACDSTVIIELSFFAPAINDFAPIWCEGQSITIDGEVYDINNPTDTVTLFGQNFQGCDSIIYINIAFSDAVEITIDDKLCPGGFIDVNGTIYDEDNPMGSDTIEMGSVSGCDSIINVDLDFYLLSDLTFNLNDTLCPGDSVIVNGVVYDEDSPSGTEEISAGSYTGCDSIVIIALQFYEPALLDYTETICQDDSVQINGVFYHVNNPIGSDIIMGGGSNGCDSIISVNLSFFDLALNVIDTTICEDSSIEINGTVYDEEGVYSDLIIDGSYLGCDSIFEITINFFLYPEEFVTAEICEGEAYVINGNTYDTAGDYVEVFTNTNPNVCDSIVYLTLIVQTAEMLGLADAGIDVNTCEDEVLLNGNIPAGATGNWASLDGAGLSNPSQANATATDLMSDTYAFVWTLSSAACVNYDADTVLVFVEPEAEANDDIYMAGLGISYLELTLLDNDNLNGINDWTIDIPNPPAGVLTDLGDGVYGFEADPSLLGTTVVFEYELCNANCTDCSTAQVTLIFEELSDEFPNAITPNEDGKNDVFVIPLLEDNPEQYLTRELIVFNRWGDVVYQEQPYMNNWNGVSATGDNLPEGTYYYVFRLDLSKPIIYKGDITILR